MSRIIVAEDDIFIRESMIAVLKSAGYSDVSACSDVDHLSNLLAEHDNNIVIMDCFLEDDKCYFVDDVDKLQNIRNSKFIIISGQDDNETINQCLHYHPTAFLSKPFSNESLVYAVKKAEQDMDDGINFFKHFSQYLHENNLSSNDVARELSSYVKSFREKKILHSKNWQTFWAFLFVSSSVLKVVRIISSWKPSRFLCAVLMITRPRRKASNFKTLPF